MFRTLLTGLIAGLVLGALFGVFFGAFASVFRNGPELLQGIRESWWWFSLVGGCMGLGWAYARQRPPPRA